MQTLSSSCLTPDSISLQTVQCIYSAYDPSQSRKKSHRSLPMLLMSESFLSHIPPKKPHILIQIHLYRSSRTTKQPRVALVCLSSSRAVRYPQSTTLTCNHFAPASQLKAPPFIIAEVYLQMLRLKSHNLVRTIHRPLEKKLLFSDPTQNAVHYLLIIESCRRLDERIL